MLVKFFDYHKVISINQFGFGQGLSTSDAVIEYLDSVYISINNKNVSITTFLDFSKAFGTIDKNIMLDKLSYYGV